MKTGKREKAKNNFVSASYKNLKIEEKSQLKSALDFINQLFEAHFLRIPQLL